MEEKKDYFSYRDYENQLKLNSVTEIDLPDFCTKFFMGIQNKTTLLTRLNYAYDLKLFFEYIITLKKFQYKNIKEIKLDDLDKVDSFDIEKFLNFISSYKSDDGKIKINGEKGKSRKLSSIRAMYKYFYNHDSISSLPASKVDTPKLHEKEIIRLQDEEIPDLLSIVESGNGLTVHQMAFHEKNKLRDTAIVTLLLGTGIRVSECVGLNIDDINFADNTFIVTRKGGNRVMLYFSDEVADALIPYIDQRLSVENSLTEKKALFISKSGERLTTRSIQLLVKKYSKIATPLKHITPHKLRSTYGTELYKQTGDIYVVADVLGHKDVNTTKRHYAAITDDIRRQASDKVKLHKNSENTHK